MTHTLHVSDGAIQGARERLDGAAHPMRGDDNGE
jgi:hypothetical protein